MMCPMIEIIIHQALERWGMSDASFSFVAGRENQVFKIVSQHGQFALRIRRPGLRQPDELHAELAWLDALYHAGLSVPRPCLSAQGRFLEEIAQYRIDMVSWLPGTPLGTSRAPLTIDKPAVIFSHLGQIMAQMHIASDEFINDVGNSDQHNKPSGFTRHSWHIEGLLGEAPVWDRFWDNPTLDLATKTLMTDFRTAARTHLTALSDSLDFGLIHADLVRENILIDQEAIHLIDFDDGGYGYRLFDIATALLKNRAEPDFPALQQALIEGYQQVRTLDVSQLDLFMALRATSYVGWIITRMDEAGSHQRNTHFITDAQIYCQRYLDSL